MSQIGRKHAQSVADKSGFHGVYIGVAGWTIPKQHAEHFAVHGSHLGRYSSRFNAVEINSSFYRPHRPATYERWAASVSKGFRFSVKMPREITHFRRLKDADSLVGKFLDEATCLGEKLGPLLVQLPPNLRFDEAIAKRFFAALRQRFGGDIVCEPRHATWFTSATERLLVDYRIARVAADPAVAPTAAEPRGWGGIAYYRLHGSPKVYYSRYSDDDLNAMATTLNARITAGPVWCIFDNTAEGEATINALETMALLTQKMNAPRQ